MAIPLLKIVEFAANYFAGRELGKWLAKKEVQKALAQAMDAAWVKAVDAGFKHEEPGAISVNFLKSEKVLEQLWGKLLDPAVDEEVDYHVLYEALGEAYADYKISRHDKEAVEFFTDALIDQMWGEPTLREMLSSKVIAQHDTHLTLAKKKTLIRDYLAAESKLIREDLQSDLGPGRKYIDPLIELAIRKDKEAFAGTSPSPSPVDFGEEEPKERFTPVDVNEYFVNGREERVGVIAESGFGKTTLLRTVFMRISNKLADDPLGSTPIPIFVTPSQAAECSESNIEAKVTMRIMSSGCRESKAKKFVNDTFQAGRCMFLIDALDQVKNRQHLMGAFEGRAFRSNRVVLTSRPEAWQSEAGHLRGFKIAHLRAFDERRWEEYAGKEKLAQLKGLVDDEFFSVPILLKLVIDHWLPYSGKKKVKNKAELYRAMFDDLLTRQEARDGAEAATGTKGDPVLVRRDLQRLAYRTMSKGWYGDFRKIDAADMLDDKRLLYLEHHAGILRVIEVGEQMQFRHRSFQEYLAAEYICGRIKNETDLVKLDTYLFNPDWEKVIQFLAGMLQNDLAPHLIGRILTQAGHRPLTIYLDHLRLAGQSAAESGESCAHLLRDVIETLEPVSRDEIMGETAFWTIDRIGSEQAVKPLIKALADESDDVRGRAADALGQIGSEQAVKPVIKALADESDYVRGRAADALGQNGSEQAVKPLIKALADESDYVRWRAAYVLGQIGSEQAVKPLIKALADERDDVRGSASHALGQIGGKLTLTELLVTWNKCENANIKQVVLSAIQTCDTNLRRKAKVDLIE